jgi:hypothetical protein
MGYLQGSEQDGFYNENHLAYSNIGDILEVKVSNSFYQVFYKKKVRISDKKELLILFNDLKNLSIDVNPLINQVESWTVSKRVKKDVGGKIMETYDVTYSCGCTHEIKIDKGIHSPTGNNKDCEEHKKKIV